MEFKVEIRGGGRYSSPEIVYICPECKVRLLETASETLFDHPDKIDKSFFGIIPKWESSDCSNAGKRFRLKPISVYGEEV